MRIYCNSLKEAEHVSKNITEGDYFYKHMINNTKYKKELLIGKLILHIDSRNRCTGYCFETCESCLQRYACNKENMTYNEFIYLVRKEKLKRCV